MVAQMLLLPFSLSNAYAQELGAGSGTSYPSALDTDSTLETTSTLAREDVPNDLGAATVAVQNELGTDPAGTISDVKTYLQTEHVNDGTHGDITVNLLNQGSLIMEGDTADGNELTWSWMDVASDVAVNWSGSTSIGQQQMHLFENLNIMDVNTIYEGATSDDFETTVTFTDPTADRTVTLGNEELNFPEQAIKGWAVWDGTDGSVDDSFNVSSISNAVATIYIITWDVDFADGNYAIAGSALGASTQISMVGISVATAPAAGTVSLTVKQSNDGGGEVTIVNAMAIGNR